MARFTYDDAGWLSEARDAQAEKDAIAQELDSFIKDRVYVESPEDAPEDVEVQEGPQGGLWYEGDEAQSSGADGGAEGDGSPSAAAIDEYIDAVEIADGVDDETAASFIDGFPQTITRIQNPEMAEAVAENLYVTELSRTGMQAGEMGFIDDFTSEGGTMKLQLSGDTAPNTINHELAHGIAELYGYSISDTALDLANDYGMGADNPPDRHYDHYDVDAADLTFREERSPDRPDEIQRLMDAADAALERQYDAITDGHPLWKNQVINDPYSATNAHETLAMTHESLAMTPSSGESEDAVTGAREGIEALVKFHDDLLKAYMDVFEPSAWAQEQIQDVNQAWGDDELTEYLNRSASGAAMKATLTTAFARQLLKERVYIDTPDEAPGDVEVQEGEQGGIYYDTEDMGEGEGEPWADASFSDLGNVLRESVGDERVQQLVEELPGDATPDSAIDYLVNDMAQSDEYTDEDIHNLYQDLGATFGSSLNDANDQPEDGEGSRGDGISLPDSMDIDDATWAVGQVVGEKAAHTLLGDMRAPDSGEAPDAEQYVNQAGRAVGQQGKEELREAIQERQEGSESSGDESDAEGESDDNTPTEDESTGDGGGDESSGDGADQERSGDGGEGSDAAESDTNGSDDGGDTQDTTSDDATEDGAPDADGDAEPEETAPTPDELIAEHGLDSLDDVQEVITTGIEAGTDLDALSERIADEKSGRYITRVLDDVEDTITTEVEGYESEAKMAYSWDDDFDFPREAEQTFMESVDDETAQETKETLEHWPLDFFSEDMAPLWQTVMDETGNTKVMDTEDEIGAVEADVSETEREAIRAHKEHVEETLRKTHGDTITMYRGIHGDAGRELREGAEAEEAVEWEGRAVESFTTELSYAKSYAQNPGGTVVEAEVPVEDVWASSFTGFLDANENEFVVEREEVESIDPDKIHTPETLDDGAWNIQEVGEQAREFQQ